MLHSIRCFSEITKWTPHNHNNLLLVLFWISLIPPKSHDVLNVRDKNRTYMQGLKKKYLLKINFWKILVLKLDKRERSLYSVIIFDSVIARHTETSLPNFS